jgi:hypothetical protein
MFEKKEQGKITFSYDSNDLFDNAGRTSAYMTKNATTESGAELDKFAITDDEKDLYNKCFKHALNKVQNTLMSLSNGVNNAFTEDAEKVTLTIKDNKAYNDNILSLVDEAIAECLLYGTLTEFYSENVNLALQKMSSEKFAAGLLLLNQRLFQLKKKRTMSLL